MSVSFNLLIKFNRSTDYVKFSFILHLLVLFGFYCVHYPVSLISMVASILSWSMVNILRNPMPHPTIQTLSYHRQYWLLQNKKGVEVKYADLHIRVNASFFLLITLSGINARKNLVIFHDQLSMDECRMLHVIDETSARERQQTN